MNINQQLVQKQIQTLKQILSPKLIQMLSTFNLPYSDLVDKIKQESQDNVFVEVTRFDQLHSYAGTKKSSSSVMGKDISDFASDQSDSVSLHAFVVNQVELLSLKDRDKDIVMFLADHLDERGFLPNYAELRREAAQKFDLQERKINEMLGVLQSLEPDGIGAKDLRDCLLIQMRHHDFQNEHLETILTMVIKNHLDDLSEGRHDVIAEACDIEEDGVEAISDFIRQNLNPNPGVGFSATPFNQHIIPSFEVEIEDNKLRITNLEDKLGIQFSISEKYLALLDDPNTDDETKAFLKQKAEAAKALKENLERRIENLNKLAHFICHKQFAFIQHGPAFLEPLLQKDIASHLGLSPSTVSRIVSSKYIITPHGIFPFKHLCPRNHFGKTSERLKDIVREVSQQYPSYSDEKIRHVLNDQFNIKIARRTIAKYRSLAQVSSSYLRDKSQPK